MTHQGQVTASINAIIDSLYFQTADQTYIVARWCSIQRLSSDFIWNAIHALEKYLKAAILSNGGSVKDLDHDILLAYERLQQIAGDLLPAKLERPRDVDLSYWRECSPTDFMKRLMKNGGAAVRYNELGYVHSQLDLFLLDELVFQIRRLCIDLTKQPHKRVTTKTRRDILKAQPDFANMQFGKLDKLHRDKNASGELKQAAFNMNIRFAPEDFEHEGFREGTNASNPALGRHIVRYLESKNPETRKVGRDVMKWYFDNNRVQKEIKQELSSVQIKP